VACRQGSRHRGAILSRSCLLVGGGFGLPFRSEPERGRKELEMGGVERWAYMSDKQVDFLIAAVSYALRKDETKGS
jgi:hypothetical protein